MPYAVIFTERAARELRALRAAERARIIDQCQRLLSVNPTLVSKARIKRLTGDLHPPYRLRVGNYRVFYDVDEQTHRVVIHGVADKARADEWFAAAQQERADEDGKSG
jgi:mRNA-degrading endonuclease RelE of RelBE toxin-antitoxin system